MFGRKRLAEKGKKTIVGEIDEITWNKKVCKVTMSKYSTKLETHLLWNVMAFNTKEKAEELFGEMRPGKKLILTIVVEEAEIK